MRISTQAAAALRQEIASRTWVDALPGERQLAWKLQVSRKTIRVALEELRAEGLIASRPGQSHAIVGTPLSHPGAATRRIGLLLREPLERMRPYTVLWIHSLRELLMESGLNLEIFHSHQYFGDAASRSLKRLVKNHPAECWILATSTQALQEWFCQAKIPAVVAGSSHPGILLPSVDIDHRALCRHAAAFLLRNGHRKIALFLSQNDYGSNAESEAGFLEALATSQAQSLIFRVGSNPPEVVNVVRKLLNSAEPPSAFLLSSPFSYLTVAGYLASIGRRVPSDVSLLSCQEEPFFAHLYPPPTHYISPPVRFATVLNRVIKQVLCGRLPKHLQEKIMPDFVRGESAGTPAP